MSTSALKDALRNREVGLRTRLHFSVYASKVGFRLLKGYRKLMNWGTRRSRTVTGEALIERTGCPVKIDPELGYRWIEPGELPGMEALISACDGVIEEARPHLPRLEAEAPGRYRIAFDLLGDDGVHQRPELVDAMVSDELLACASDYLGGVPLLRRVAVGYSPGHEASTGTSWAGSQLFHFDGEDDRQIKVFVLLTDVEDDRDGPLTFLPAAASREAVKKLGKRPAGPVGSYMRAGPYADEAVREVVDPRDLVTMTGKRGRVLLLDTSTTLHQGSRVHHGHERTVFMGVFQRFELVHETPFNWIDPSRFDEASPQGMALTPPRRVPRNFYFPDPLEQTSATARRGNCSKPELLAPGRAPAA
ncbi:MAG: hypothetical protein P8M11_07780 [Planctomycetota bacterium]|nr:hypothetical protein [Planctomycetota bacterium]MDG1984450.1 hypothetical protein [Planctomycetota bacterium]